MKTFTKTIIVILTLSLLAPFAPAQNASREESRDNLDVNTREGGMKVVLAQAQTSQPALPLPSTPSPAPAPTPPAVQSSSSVDFATDNFSNMLRDFSWNSRSDSAGTVLVIPSEQTTTEDLITINEDMNVMSRIFEKNLEKERVTTVNSGMFISDRYSYGTLLGSSRGQMQSMYLQGFGALFLMRVDFPLSPPPDEKEKQQETQKAEQGDPVWQQIRQEMYEPGKMNRERRKDRPESKYDAEKVENLKTTLIKTLKHANNIRCLKPDESVILTVVGAGESTGVSIASASSAPGQIVVVQKGPDGTKTQRLIQGNSLDALEDIGLSSPMVLVIRTKKSDIDDFSKGDLDFDKFRQRVQLLTYPMLGGADGRGDSFNPFVELRSSSSSNMRR